MGARSPLRADSQQHAGDREAYNKFFLNSRFDHTLSDSVTTFPATPRRHDSLQDTSENIVTGRRRHIMKTGTAETAVQDLLRPAKVATRSGFFLYMSLGFLAVALIGFSTTFVLPLARGTFAAAPIVYAHGVLLFTWLIFFIAQAALIRVRNVLMHRRLGWVGAFLGIAVVISGVVVSFHRVRRGLAAGADDVVLRDFLNNVLGILIFGSLVTAAVALRHDIESHKRLLLLATASIVYAAWSKFDQFFPAVENYWVFLTIANSPFLAAVGRDLMAYGRVHPVYIWVGGFFFAYDLINPLVYQSAAWLRVAQWLLGEAAA